MVGGRFHKQRNLRKRLLRVGYKMSRCPYLSTSILEVYMENLTGFNHICCPGTLRNTSLSQGCILGNNPHCGNGGQSICSKGRVGSEESPTAWFQLLGQVEVLSSPQPPPTPYSTATLTCLLITDGCFLLQWQKWPEKPKIFPIWPLQKLFTDPWFRLTLWKQGEERAQEQGRG